MDVIIAKALVRSMWDDGYIKHPANDMEFEDFYEIQLAILISKTKSQ